MLEDAYDDFRSLASAVGDLNVQEDADGKGDKEQKTGIDLEGGMETMLKLASLPKSWPLARLLIPLQPLAKQLERLIAGYLFILLGPKERLKSSGLSVCHLVMTSQLNNSSFEFSICWGLN